jgi:hypothetical protein
MANPYPIEPKKRYEFLVRRAETYTRRDASKRSLRLWRGRAVDWLKHNAPNSDLADALL